MAGATAQRFSRGGLRPEPRRRWRWRNRRVRGDRAGAPDAESSSRHRGNGHRLARFSMLPTHRRSRRLVGSRCVTTLFGEADAQGRSHGSFSQSHLVSCSARISSTSHAPPSGVSVLYQDDGGAPDHWLSPAAPRNRRISPGRFWITMIRVAGLRRTIAKVRPSGETS
jgi:hypothetical protein